MEKDIITTILGKSKPYYYFIDKNGSVDEVLCGFRAKIRDDLRKKNGDYVYIYYLDNNSINVTDLNTIIYIGKSESRNQNTYERFMHEIYEDNNGNDKAKQYTLTHFYERGIRMRLEVFFVEDCREVEKALLHKHKVTFGYLPIANGKEG